MPPNTTPSPRKSGAAAKSTGTAPAAKKATGGPARPSGGKPGSQNRATAAKATAAKATPAKSGSRPTTANRGGGRPPGKPPKSIVNQRQRPWGLIITAIIVVIFAAGVIIFAVTRTSKPNAADANYVRDEIAAAKAINGVIYKKEPDHTHVTAKVSYDSSPPVGGNHAQFWADCTGVVYSKQIANENAVHSLEHGAVWITYNPNTLSAADVAVLAKKVTGIDRMFMTPYAGLKTAISLQSWDYQLFVDKANDPRIDQFIKVLKFNPATTPEPAAQCATSDGFAQHPSTPENPTF